MSDAAGPTDGGPSLEALRAELDAHDGELLALAAKRLQIVARIREAKQRSGKHLFDRAREQAVFRKAEARASELGLDPAVARGLMGTLVEASHNVQQALVEEDSTAIRKVLIIGGRGKMGRLFGRLLEERGHHIDVIEQGDPLEAGRISASDVVMVAVPMTEAVEVTTAVAPHVRSDALLCDINSLKREVCAAMQASTGEALGTHPMFGPTVRSLRRQKVVLCTVKPGPMGAWLQAELGRMGAEVVVTEPETHDRTMAVVQVLTHFGIMAMGSALAHSGLELASTLQFTSPIYRLELAMVGRLFSQKPELYREILMTNPEAKHMRDVYAREVGTLTKLLDGTDREGFVTAFEEVAAYFADFSDDAMELSDHIIENIMSRP
jgi:chorismate mutase/prephenate dehydrogenase